jgi:hypothetical protein
MLHEDDLKHAVPASKELLRKIDKALGQKTITLVLPTRLYNMLFFLASVHKVPLPKYLVDCLWHSENMTPSEDEKAFNVENNLEKV